MDDKTKQALAEGKVTMSTRHGRFVSSHDTMDEAVNASLEDDRMGMTFNGPLTADGRADMKAKISRAAKKLASSAD